MDVARVQEALREAQLDGWLFYDHHVRDPLAYRILGLDPSMHVTRRWFYFIPATGEPRKLNHRIEAGKLDTLPGERTLYSTWQEMEAALEQMLKGATRIAMQYSPRNAVMYVAMVDAGTIEVLNGMGKEIVSSANLVSRFEAVLTEQKVETHYVAQRKIDRILEDGWREMGSRVRGAGTDEFAMVEWLQAELVKEGLVWEHGPNVSVGPNAADSHYEPLAGKSSRIERGSFVLIDIWGKLKDDPSAVWYDITWTGVVDRDPTELEGRVFRTVVAARDAAIRLVEERFAAGKVVAGWEPDAAAREVIVNAGFGEWFTHRTGHNIGTEL
ncbi:MAG: M24 family metallopeptidase, partial [Terriglobus sp.]